MSQFVREPVTGNYLQELVARTRERQAPPTLQPSARVKQIDRDVKSSLPTFYNRLDSINKQGNDAYAAAQAKRARQQAIQSRLTATIPSNQLATGAAIPSNPQANFRFAQQLAGQYGWDPAQLQAWYNLGMKESGWRHTAQNPKSTAFGIGQFLDSTWKTVGGSKTSDPATQVALMAKYIKQRYGSPAAALAFHLRNNWY
jgi:hypothetical protein